MSQIFKFPLDKETKKKLGPALQQKGLVFVYPTASYYALGCKANDEVAVKKIYHIKERKEDNPLLVLVKGAAMLQDYTKPPTKEVEILMEKAWPGPLTLLLQAKGLAKSLNNQGDLVGFRHDEAKEVNELIELVAVPLVGTSANKSGEAAKTKLAEVTQELGDAVDYYFDGGTTKGGEPSTVATFEAGEFKILRQGAYNL